MPHIGKNIRCQYDRADLEKAVTAVNCGMSVRKAAATFNVPRSTLHDRVKGRVEIAATPGKRTIFPLHVERMLADRVKEAAEMGFGIDRKQLRVKAARLAATLKLSTPFKNGIPGDDWVNAFLKRNSLSLRSQVALSTVRSRMLNPTVVSKYFKCLSDTVESLDLVDKPQRIWNMDETSVSLTHKPTRVFAQKGTRNVPGRVGNSRESITALVCINAAGSDIAPMIVVKGKTKKSLNAYDVAAGPHGATWTYQSKGWMEESLGTEWFSNVFLPSIGPERQQLLILDSHSSHESLDIVECALENGITLFTLPPHTTQWLNPLDKTVFGPFSREYDRTCTQFMAASPNNLVCKWVWPGIFKIAYEKTITKYNITKGFQTCGIHPICENAIPKSAFKPSDAFDQQSTMTLASNITEEVIPLQEANPLTHDEHTTPRLDLVEQTPTEMDISTPSTGIVSINIAEKVILPKDATTLTLNELTIPRLRLVEQTPPEMDTSIPTPSTGIVYDAVGTTSALVESTVLGTADETGTVFLEAVTAADMLEAIMNSGITAYDQIMPMPEVEAVSSLFTLPVSNSKQAPKKHKLTSHRILTSEEIVNQKREAKRIKEEEVKAKETRNIERKIKQEENSKKKLEKITKKRGLAAQGGK